MPDVIETINNVNKVATDLDLTARTNAILDYLGDNVKRGTELVKDQLPLVAQDVISWGIWSNFFPAGISLFLIIAYVVFMRKFCKYFHNNPVRETPTHITMIIIAMLGLLCSVFTVGSFVANTSEGLKALVAPRVYLIEWTTDQIKQINRNNR